MSVPGDEAERWLAAGLRDDPERFRPVIERYPVLSSEQIRRALAHEVLAGDGETVEAVAFRYGPRETGRRVPVRSSGP